MEILNVKISRYSEIITGVKLYENDNFLVILENPVDYVIDGVCFICKKYLKSVEKIQDDILKFKILKYKSQLLKINYDFQNFKTIKDVINYFSFKKNKLIQLNLASSSYVLIGNTSKLNEKSFILNMLSVKANFLEEEKIEYNKIRILSVDNDYLNSMEYYLKASVEI